jgi:hypothetical protein
MGAEGGNSSNGMAYDPSMTGRPMLQRGYTDPRNEDPLNPYIAVGYKDETLNGKDPSQGRLGNALLMKQNDFNAMRDEVASAGYNYGMKGIEDLVKGNVAKYYDVTKNILLTNQEHYNRTGKAFNPELQGVMGSLGKDWTKEGSLFNSYDNAIKIHKAELDAPAPTGSVVPTTGGSTGEVGDGSLLTSIDKERKRQQGLVATNGALTLGSTSLLGA